MHQLPPPLTLKKRLYLTLIRSHISYCCQLWRPYLVKDFLAIEKIQRRTTKYILGNYVVEYKTRLISLNMLPLMYWLDLQDLLFVTKCLQDPKDTIRIHQHVTFINSNTRAGSTNKLCHRFARLNSTRHFYFFRIVRLWNYIPNDIMDLTLSLHTNKVRLITHFWTHFIKNFDSNIHCTYHYLCSCSKCIV